jgi:ADP-heptose:LPS heptosyltransferase
METPQKLIIKNSQSPGDIIMLTAAIRDLHRAHPGKFITDLRTSAGAIWDNNPYVTKIDDKDKDVKIINAEYPLVHKSNSSPYHFIHGFRMDLESKLGISIPATEFKGDIHISSLEKSWMSQVNEITGEDTKFWIVVSGGKYDFTAKWWNPQRWQDVVDYFWGKITFVQCGEKSHSHPDLKNVINLVGKTDLRQMIRLMYHADGVICPVTMFMHMAAAVETKPGKLRTRPCVVVAGGREPSQWEAYPGHQYLHTIGALPCCDTGGCWKSRVMPLGDNDSKDKSLCTKPTVSENGIIIPKCLDMITSNDVIRAIERYTTGNN